MKNLAGIGVFLETKSEEIGVFLETKSEEMIKIYMPGSAMDIYAV